MSRETGEREEAAWLEAGLGHVWLPYTQMKTTPPPLPVVASDGVRLELADGRTLIDGIASWWTACHGYNHPHIRQAVEAQLAVLPHVMFGGLTHEPGLSLARRLAALLPGDLSRVFFSESGSVSVEIAIGLIGIMALWLGIMKISEESGLIRIIARGLKPITIRLFPDVPADHPAIGSIVLNMSANMLGLGNAATPLGLKAMEELQELNDKKDTATNAMVMFLAINTSSVQLILPATVVALMGATASDIFITTILATLFSTIAAITAVKLLEKMKRFRVEGPDDGGDNGENGND